MSSSKNIEALAFHKLKQLGGCATRLFRALLPSCDGCLSYVEKSGEDALAGTAFRSNPMHLFGREFRTRRQAEGIELTHGEIVHMACVGGGQAEVRCANLSVRIYQYTTKPTNRR